MRLVASCPLCDQPHVRTLNHSSWCTANNLNRSGESTAARRVRIYGRTGNVRVNTVYRRKGHFYAYDSFTSCPKTEGQSRLWSNIVLNGDLRHRETHPNSDLRSDSFCGSSLLAILLIKPSTDSCCHDDCDSVNQDFAGLVPVDIRC